MDELVVDSLVALWQLEQRGEKVCAETQICWLLGTVKNKKLEKLKEQSRRCSHCGTAERFVICDPVEAIEPSPARSEIQFDHLRVWRELPQDQRQALTECLMFDRGVTEFSREIGRKRTTVNGWIIRIPKRFARDAEFQSLRCKLGASN